MKAAAARCSAVWCRRAPRDARGVAGEGPAGDERRAGAGAAGAPRGHLGGCGLGGVRRGGPAAGGATRAQPALPARAAPPHALRAAQGGGGPQAEEQGYVCGRHQSTVLRWL